MISALDTSVLVDVIHQETRAVEALAEASESGQLMICEMVYAELCVGMKQKQVQAFLNDFKIQFVNSNPESLTVTGDMWREFLKQGGRRGHILADFFIGAHALVNADCLLSTDRGFYREYFKKLKVVSYKE